MFCAPSRKRNPSFCFFFLPHLIPAFSTKIINISQIIIKKNCLLILIAVYDHLWCDTLYIPFYQQWQSNPIKRLNLAPFFYFHFQISWTPIPIRNNVHVSKRSNVDGLRHIKVDWFYILYKYFHHYITKAAYI